MKKGSVLNEGDLKAKAKITPEDVLKLDRHTESESANIYKEIRLLTYCRGCCSGAC